MVLVTAGGRVPRRGEARWLTPFAHDSSTQSLLLPTALLETQLASLVRTRRDKIRLQTSLKKGPVNLHVSSGICCSISARRMVSHVFKIATCL
jgi:hypothetical protein